MGNVFFQLIKIRLLDSLGGWSRIRNKNAKKGSGLAKAILLIILLGYCAVVFCGMFAAMFYMICESYVDLGIGWLYFTIAAILSFALCFVGNVFTAQNQLYNSRDNELLLSMPIPSSFILAGRVISLVITAFVYESVVMLPAIVIWAICGKFDALSFFGWLVISIAVPLISTALSAIVGGLVALITSKIKLPKNLMSILFSIVFFIAYFAVFGNISEYMQMLLDRGAELAELIRIKAWVLFAVGLAGEGDVLGILILTLVSSLFFALVYFILSKTFIKISILKTGTPKVKYRRGKEKASTPFVALLKREFSIFISSAVYVLNSGMGMIMSLLFAAFLIAKGETFTELFSSLGELEKFIDIAILFLGMELASLTTISSASVSIEGKRIYLSQSMPIDPAKALLAKVLNHALIAEIGVVIVGIALSTVIPGGIIMKLMYFLLPTAMNLFCAFIGVVMNIKFAKLDWINEAVAVKQGASVILSMLITSGVSILYFILSLILTPFIPTEPFALLFTAFLVAICYIMYSYLCNKGAAKYSTLGTE